MARHTLIFLMLCISTRLVLPEPTEPPTEAPAEPRDEALADTDEPPEGYYAFVESPNATPPRVRPPPYRQVSTSCPEMESNKPHVSANNLCGDLNRGVIPRNPMGQNPNGEPYPFELLRNQTLRFLSRTLPVLRADDTLPRVAHLRAHAQGAHTAPEHHNRLEERSKRSVQEAESPAWDSSAVPSHALRPEHRASDAPRDSRKFCDNGGVARPRRARRAWSTPRRCSRATTRACGATSCRYPTRATSRRPSRSPDACSRAATTWTAAASARRAGCRCWWPSCTTRPDRTNTHRTTSSSRRLTGSRPRPPTSRRTATDTTRWAATRFVCTTTGSWSPARASAGDRTTSRDTCVVARTTNCKRTDKHTANIIMSFR